MSFGHESELREIARHIETQMEAKFKDIQTLQGHIDGLNDALNKVKGILAQLETASAAREFAESVKGSGKARLGN